MQNITLSIYIISSIAIAWQWYALSRFAASDVMKKQLQLMLRWSVLAAVVIIAHFLLRDPVDWQWYLLDIAMLTAVGSAFRDGKQFVALHKFDQEVSNGWLLQLWFAWMLLIGLGVYHVIWFN